MSEPVTLESVDYPHAIFLPEVCYLPTSGTMRWPLDVGFTDFALSVQGAMGPAGVVFQQMLQRLKLMLAAWFEIVPNNKEEFVIPSCAFNEFYDLHYLAIDNGQWPSTSTVLDQEAPPLLDMLHGHLWLLWCDKKLTTASKTNRQHLNTYLNIGEKLVLAETYLGANITGRFFPNYAHHFKVTNGWPTDNATIQFFYKLVHLPFLSYQAKQYDPMEVDLHQPQLALLEFETREEKMSDLHKSRTLKYTKVQPKQKPPNKKPGETAKARPESHPKGALNGALDIPESVGDYSPSPYVSQRTTPMESAQAKPRKLEDELMASTAPSVASLGVGNEGATCVLRRFDPLVKKLETAEDRKLAPEQYKNVCRLAACCTSLCTTPATGG
jgi:hypothetical protein